VITIVVHGTPAPQGSKKAFHHKQSGKIVMREMSKRVAPWRDSVRSDAIDARERNGGGLLLETMDGPLVADMVFTFVRPRSHYRTGKNAHLLRDDAPTRPQGAPDLSKLARSTEDALTDAGVWRDDARVVEYGRLAKVYVGEDADALDSPGAVIRVRPYEASTADARAGAA
jgi:Holliday junction resolvase RusA-like endonuclease